MLRGFIVLVALQMLGDAISDFMDIPIPGAVLGMLMLLTWLCISKAEPVLLNKTAQSLFPYLPLFLIPASAGVINYIGLVQKEWLTLLVSLVASTLLGILATPYILKVVKTRLFRSTSEQAK